MKVKHFEKVNRYRNSGQNLEFAIRSAYGKKSLADNIHGADMVINGITYQIKSSHCTIGKGETLSDALAYCPSDIVLYAIADTTVMFEMTYAEWAEICTRYGVLERESAKNGGTAKFRLKRDSRGSVAYLLSLTDTTENEKNDIFNEIFG